MTLKKISSAGLIALTALTVGLIMADGALAQTAAPAAADAAPAAAAAPKLDTGDTAWMLTSTALVLMMTIPGLGLFYGGMVRKKNVLSTVMQSFAITCLVTVLWMILGYSLAFTEGSMNAYHRQPVEVVPRRSRRDHDELAGGDHPGNRVHHLPDDLRHHHPGADLRRLCRAHEVLGDDVVHAVCGCCWSIARSRIGSGAGGFLGSAGVLDFAGGTVVHINAGVAGLVCAIVLGKRKGYGTIAMAPHNLTWSVHRRLACCGSAGSASTPVRRLPPTRSPALR